MKKCKLLIVEDNRVFSKGLKYYYEKFFDEIYTAENKKKAMKILNELTVDSAIVDLMLDDNSDKYEGVEIIKEMRHNKKYEKTKIAVVTAVEDDSVLAEVDSDERVKLFSKPVNIEELSDAIL